MSARTTVRNFLQYVVAEAEAVSLGAEQARGRQF